MNIKLFKYFGSKAVFIKHYPKPLYPRVVEPFAGSASYSCAYPDKEVVLYDVDIEVISIINFLIQSAPQDILGLPLLSAGQNVNSLNVNPEVKRLISRWCGAVPTNKLTTWGVREMLSGTKTSYWGAACRQRLSGTVTQIKHWQVHLGPYNCIPNEEATWFVDPPYSSAKLANIYQVSNRINYKMLAAWCLSRKGQVIICEKEGASWLPFKVLLHNQRTTSHNTSTEVYCHIQDGRII